MSAVGMAVWPKQTMAMSGEGRSHLSPLGALDGTDMQHVDLCALARHAVALLHATGHMQPDEVQLELPDEPVFARVSRLRMEQVMLHLMTSAVEARRSAEASTRAVRLTVEPQDDFGDYGPTFRLRYVTGVEQEPRDAVRSASAEGLEVARELVELLGGSFAVKGHGLTGTTVTVSVELPDQGTASW